MKTFKYIFAAAALMVTGVYAQRPTPAPKQEKSIIIRNATIHIGNGNVIQNGVIAFDRGKISLVADATTIRIDFRKYDEVMDAYGMHVYPGLIGLANNLGLTEIDMVRSTRDAYEVGEFNPNVRSVIAYNADSRIIPTVRSNGVLLSQVVPAGDAITGSSSIMQLDAWNWEDATITADEGIWVVWPNMYINRSPNAKPEEKQRERILNELAKLDQVFAEAKAYNESKMSETNLKFDAMKGLFNGSKKLYVLAYDVKAITAALDFASRYQLKLVLVGANDAVMMADRIAKAGVPIILERMHRLPSRDEEPVDAPYTLATKLTRAGVKVALSIDGSWQVRNLPFMAGTAAAHGLDKEEALQCITLNPAQIAGIDKNYGSLEQGKSATLILSTGDLLDMKSSKVTAAFIDGRKIDLNNHQTELNNQYNEKYGIH
jgi:imidazolonepropionase-like amidohydrolase